jgi:hypothetical protein
MKKRNFVKLLIVVGLLTAMPVSAQVGQGLETAIAAQERHTQELMINPAVVGTAVGLNAAGRPAVIIFTETRGVPGLPDTLDGVPVVVRQSGRIYALPKCSTPPCGGSGGGSDGGTAVDPTARFERPVPIGVSTGHPAITAGTIGARVTDGTDVYALSNNHVYANENQATLGDAVIQPGTFDDGVSPADDIGALDDFEPIVFGGTPNTIDAAIALTNVNDVGNATPSDGYGTPKSTTVAPQINQKVMKYGRTTRLTTGSVYALNATVDVQYSEGVARFVNQVIIQPGSFSAGGDSGSLIVVNGKGPFKNDDRKPVGLLFAGSVFFTIANPIDPVLNRFGVTIDGE